MKGTNDPLSRVSSSGQMIVLCVTVIYICTNKSTGMSFAFSITCQYREISQLMMGPKISSSHSIPMRFFFFLHTSQHCINANPKQFNQVLSLTILCFPYSGIKISQLGGFTVTTVFFCGSTVDLRNHSYQLSSQHFHDPKRSLGCHKQMSWTDDKTDKWEACPAVLFSGRARSRK